MVQKISGFYDLHHVIYVSRATGEVYQDQAACVDAILRASRKNNPALNVTGALLACDNWFVQVLEGRRIDVETLLDRISADASHMQLRRVLSLPLTERRFARWSMCASTLSPTDKAIVEVLQGSGRFDGRKLDGDAAMRLLLAVARLQTARGVEQQVVC